jgi:hypothetical protein
MKSHEVQREAGRLRTEVTPDPDPHSGTLPRRTGCGNATFHGGGGTVRVTPLLESEKSTDAGPASPWHSPTDSRKAPSG